MSVKPLVVLLGLALVGTPLLAGCIGKKGTDLPIAQQNSTRQNTILPNETKTPEGQQISAFKETNATESGKGGMSHTHDYWHGQSRAQLYQQTFTFIPLPLTPKGGYAPGTAIADLNIPAPKLVYEGTSQLELLFSHVDASPAFLGAPETGQPTPGANLLVKYITAKDDPGQWHDAGKVTPNSPLVIPVKPLEADMPHSVASLWLFRIYTDAATEISFNLTITAVRGSAVAVWPPHPDLYAKGPTRIIYDAASETTVGPATDFTLYGEDSNWFFPEKVISYGTDKLVIDVTDLTYAPGPDAQIAAPNYFYLDFHNASFAPKIGNGATSGGTVKDPATDGKKFHFEMPTTPYGYDTPYGTKSRWAFRMLASFTDQIPPDHDIDSTVCYNCRSYKLSYHLKITAVGHSTAAEGIDMMDMSAQNAANSTKSGGASGAAETGSTWTPIDVPYYPAPITAVPSRL